ncbi:Phytase-like domain containing protein [Sulfitobacter guttiformis KCTC 32187]|nr:Phytase-like domain containing protein [Sulfitobacter guttiformis KCTC 32187]
MDLDPQTGRTGNRIALPFRNSLGDNSGIEALAIGLDGTLFALTEAAPARGHPFPLYTYTDGQWRVAAHIPQRGPFVPVGADIDALGRFWLLERTVTPIGFRSRVRMFVLDPHAPREYTLMTSIPARYDNLEGISVWSDQDGLMHVTLISDDNFFALQRTQIVEFVVIE